MSGFFETFITVVAVIMSLYHLYAAVATVTTQILRGVHVAFVLFLGFLVFPPSRNSRQRIAWYDILLALLGVATIAYMLFDFEEFIYRAVTPTSWDLLFGVLFIVLVLEVARRATGLGHALHLPPLPDSTPTSARPCPPPGPTGATTWSGLWATCT